MPHLDDTREALLDAGENAQKRVHRAWEGFQDFALRDNVLEVAVGLMYWHSAPFSGQTQD